MTEKGAILGIEEGGPCAKVGGAEHGTQIAKMDRFEVLT